MKVNIRKIDPILVPYKIEEGELHVSLSDNSLATVTQEEFESLAGDKPLPLRTLINCNLGQHSLVPQRVFLPKTSLSNSVLVPFSEAFDSVSAEDSQILLNVFDTLLSSDSSVMQGETHEFGTLTLFLHSLGSSNYRIEWYSKMTGASTSIAKLGRTSWAVIRKWAPKKNMIDISQAFDSRKQALNHFIANVDILKNRAQDVDDAKRASIEMFLRLEGISSQTIKRIPKVRLQGAIGQVVEIRANHDKNQVVAKGILLQILGKDAQVKITERIDFSNPRPFVTVPMTRVWL